jgi:penicillin-binding protein 1A
MSKIFKLIISIAVYGLILVSTIIISLIVFYAKELPSYEVLHEYDPSAVTRIYTANGQLMSEYAEEHRIFIPINAIPKKVVNAFLAAEDADYYKHPGIDFRGIIRAFLQNIINVNRGKALVGGSTITQQVVKNFLLSDEKSIKRKIQEAVLSFRINATISKDRILELYLNQIFLGNHSYGIASAALNYFDKEIEDLRVEEVALLAALPKAPSKYNPVFNYDGALARRNWVLEKMLENKFITQTEFDSAIQKPIVLKSSLSRSLEEDYFAEEVRQIIAEQYGSDTLYKGGLNVYTTYQPKLQDVAQQVLQKHLIQYDENHGYRGPITNIEINDDWPKALITKSQNIIVPIKTWRIAVVLKINKNFANISLIDGKEYKIDAKSLQWTKKPIDQLFKVGDVIYVEPDLTNESRAVLRQVPEVNGSIVMLNPHTGKVLALVGGFSYKISKFNRVTQAIRQPGSAFKPFVYLAALENGFSPNTIVHDMPIELFQGHNLPMWKPKNYDNNFLGPITLRTALEKSRNTPTIRLAQKLGIKKISEIGQRFGLYDQPLNNFSSVLGAIDTTPLKLINAYAMIANGGYKISPVFIDRIQDRNGKNIYNFKGLQCPQCVIVNYDGNIDNLMPPSIEQNFTRIVDAQNAYQLISILNGVIKRGTGKKANIANVTLAGKTGTTNESKDVWFIGFTPDLVIGVFVGFDQPKSLGQKATGASIALPIFSEIAQKVLGNVKDKPFEVAVGIDFYKIDLRSGYLANDNTPPEYVIVEAFKENDVITKELKVGQESQDEVYFYNDSEIRNLLQELEQEQESNL